MATIDTRNPLTINGRKVRSATVFRENDFYRWRIRDVQGNEYLDGGNFPTRADAKQSLKKAFDPHSYPTEQK